MIFQASEVFPKRMTVLSCLVHGGSWLSDGGTVSGAGSRTVCEVDGAGRLPGIVEAGVSGHGTVASQPVMEDGATSSFPMRAGGQRGRLQRGDHHLSSFLPLTDGRARHDSATSRGIPTGAVAGGAATSGSDSMPTRHHGRNSLRTAFYLDCSSNGALDSLPGVKQLCIPRGDKVRHQWQTRECSKVPIVSIKSRIGVSPEVLISFREVRS